MLLEPQSALCRAGVARPPGRHAKLLINVAYVQQIERDCGVLATAYRECGCTFAGSSRFAFRPSRLGCVGKSLTGVLYVIAMAAVVVAVDLLFFRGHFWERFTANVGIVLVFVAFYFRFVRQS